LNPSHVGIWGTAALGIAATITFSGAGSAWVALDTPGVTTHPAGAHVQIVQIGIRDGPQQPGGIPDDVMPHYFAAWGDASTYTEVDLGPADTKPHRYKLWLSGSTYALAIDGQVRLRVDPPAWTPTRAMAMAESHSTVMPRVGIAAVTDWNGDVWHRANYRMLASGMAAHAASRLWGRDYMYVRPE
jgi:hypothetical protein